MKQERFKREGDEGLVIIKCKFPNHEVALALDTGASHTTKFVSISKQKQLR